MGNCLLSVHAVGGHHNGNATDIDQMSHDFVDALKKAGHTVTAATLHVGGEYDLSAERFPLNAPPVEPPPEFRGAVAQDGWAAGI